MSGSKIRNITIVALLVINALFMTFILVDLFNDARSHREAIENTSAILKAGGLMINTDNIESAGVLRTMRTARVIEVEESIARALLGETVMSDHGVISLYKNPERGAAEFYSAGDFEVRLSAGVIYRAEPLRTVASLLREIELETTQMTATIDPETSNEVVTVWVAYRGTSVFNCFIEFVFDENYLLIVRGRYVAVIEQAEGGATISQVSSALLGFLAAVRDEYRGDITCTEILSVQAGFRHRVVGAFGEGVLDPVWLIATDNGRFLIDDATGEIWPFG
ncbi:MAG: hypothetical protein FWC66_09660 [Oscillospiraceae bacterium]|nr:hypothetical protein [Oscillospiraceae bacterium]